MLQGANTDLFNPLLVPNAHNSESQNYTIFCTSY